MKRANAGEHFSFSLTDMMTSLMVIFVLLLVSKLNNQAGQRAAVAAAVETHLVGHMKLFKEEQNVKRASIDPNTIVITIPDHRLNFDTQAATIKPEGFAYLYAHVPQWAGILCSSEIRPNVDTIVVEGHSDRTRWQGSTYEESKEKNLVLSQQRSMAVVSTSVLLLKDKPALRDCFLEKLSATGRGEEDPVEKDIIDSPKNRRVIFRIRIKQDVGRESAGRLRRSLTQ